MSFWIGQNDDFFSWIYEAEVLFGDFVDVSFGSVVFIVLEFLEIFLSEFVVFPFKVRDMFIDLVALVYG